MGAIVHINSTIPLSLVLILLNTSNGTIYLFCLCVNHAFSKCVIMFLSYTLSTVKLAFTIKLYVGTSFNTGIGVVRS